MFHDYPKSWTGVSGTISKFDRAGFLIFVLVFVSRDSELDQNLSGDFQENGRNQGQGQGHSREVDHQSLTGLIIFFAVFYVSFRRYKL